MAGAMTTEQKIIARISDGTPFVFRELWTPYGIDEAYRLADKIIQKWRKAGHISYVMTGREYIWSLTETGKKYVQSLSAGDPA